MNGYTITPTAHQVAYRAGFTETIPVIPPNATLHEHSLVDPDARGKVPADFYSGAWDGLGCWPSYQMTEALAVKWDQLGANVGLKCGPVWVALDIDVTDEILARAMYDYLMGEAARTGAVWPVRVGKAPKFMILFKVSGDPILSRQYPMRKEGVEGRQLIEVKGQSNKKTPTQVVIYGGHPEGMDYQWDRTITADMMPLVTQEYMDALVDYCLRIAESHGWTRGRATKTGSNDGTSALGAQPFDQSLVAPLVDMIGNDDLEYDDWVRVGYAIKASLGDVGWQAFATWSAKAAKDDPKMTKRIWSGLKPDGSTGFGTLVHLARQDQGGFLPPEIASRVRYGAAVSTMPTSPAGVPLAPADGAENTPWIDYVVDSDGNPVANKGNVHAYLHNMDMWRDCFAFDAFNQQPIMTAPIPKSPDRRVGRMLTDNDYRVVHVWFQMNVFQKITKGDVIDAVDIRCHENVYEPVQHYLEGVQWDGVPRISNWLIDYGGVVLHTLDPSKLHYVGQVGRKWMISAVARAMKPGCQVDHALILEGGQGVGKSSVLRELCPDPDWFSDGVPDFHTKDASEHLNGKWIIELAELTSVWRSNLEDMRRFLTRRVEQYRASYGRLETKAPRRCVFAGTTNRDDYIKDAEGERRFWIVRCDGVMDIAGVKRDRDQLWAEAVHAYKAGEQWWLSPEMEAVARQVQQSRNPKEEWEVGLTMFLADKSQTCVRECMFALGLEPINGKRDTKMEQAVGRALRQNGWVPDGVMGVPYRNSRRFIRV
ncbi:putative P-loop ATPase [Shimia thalassica]|uniref:Putative P-loop ATPase n=1 Tax=Shimia thalassica TaxID=1715693 RepID=A0A0P1IHX5_9RHOB|nr:VapE domain-containing protein [Shimia thalassica]CUJ94795.1 putative P-loop ATPase [Shimia thalassica]